MPVRGEYSEAEKRMIAETERVMDEAVGWGTDTTPFMATEESIQNMAFMVDKWNPLWRDPVYGANTRWGSIIAFPMFEERFTQRGIGSMRAAKECGYQHMIYMGDDWEIFKPVRPDDSIRLWYRRPRIIDVTDSDCDGPRTFLLIEADRDYINQRDEIVSRARLYVQRSFLKGPPKPQAMEEYGYAEEELLFLDRLIRHEHIQGAEIRYWEDVAIEEEPTPVVMGPTSMADNTIITVLGPNAGSTPFARQALLENPLDTPGEAFLKDAQTGLLYMRGGPIGRHWSDRAARAEGEPRAFLFALQSKFSMVRLITNWMGDDGFIRAFKWRHVTRTPVGDAAVAYGRVVGKRIEYGECLVDLQVWLENMRGNITEIASATVSLVSRQEDCHW